MATFPPGWVRGRVVGPAVAAVAAASAVALAQGIGGRLDPALAITVVDGDTVEQGGHRFRLAGFDAPEIQHAKCQAEREAGLKAGARLIALLAERPHHLVTLGKSGGFGRKLGRLEIGGEDVAQIAVREGWGVACVGRCQRKDHDWCAAK